MGRILEYVVLLSNLSVILGATQYLNPLQGDSHGRGSSENFTHLKQVFPRERSDFFSRKLLPAGPPPRKRAFPQRQILTSVGLHAYASDTRRRNVSEHGPRFSDRRNLPPPFSQGLYPRRQPKNYFIPSQKLSRLNNHTNSFDYHKRADGINRKYGGGRNPRYHHAPRVCDPCNSVPWVPLLKVPDSYRQQRTHVTELHPTPHQNLNFDFHAFPTDAHNVLLPPVPLPAPVFDGTISSSFGLPIGNIPTGHGLLAPPITHDVHSINTVDYNSPFNFYSPHGLLENNNVPELSPVPVVPIHDSAQFFQFDSSIPDLVPPPSKPIDVSKVVLTISEDQKPPPPNHKSPSPDLTSQSTAVDFQAAKDNTRSKDFGRLEIVKSVPLAEFVSSSHQQQLPLYPPLQSEFPEGSKKEFHQQHDFLVPPGKQQSVTYNKTADAKDEASAPKPLTSPSLSWLFSDHTSPPADSKITDSVSSFATDVHQIASVVNNELRPVSPQPLSTPADHSKSKKIQIIIPYTTKSKHEHDSSALESVQHEVFHPPASKAAKENLPRPPTSPLPPTTEKYVSEMHHIIASNIRELLREEIEKAQKDQNYPLQNNIDNWTALEYSNHKTVASKAPKEIIAQALAVTSIPGTSISHLLLPSKKIPSEYFVTTPLPVFDEPNPSTYRTDNSSVHSRPFTAKPYATTNVYNPTRLPGQTGKGNEYNHEKNYTGVERGRVNTWGRLNENLVLPEARARTTTTWSGPFHPPSTGTEKVQIVTPTPQRNRTTASFRRTTRHARTTQTTGSPVRNPLPLPLHRPNSTRLEKVSNLTAHFGRNITKTVPIPSANASRTETTTPAPSTDAVVTEPQKVLQLSINDIFPFRNKELPWEEKHNGTKQASVGRQRKSLIKQSNLHRPKAVVGSS